MTKATTEALAVIDELEERLRQICDRLFYNATISDETYQSVCKGLTDIRTLKEHIEALK